MQKKRVLIVFYSFTQQTRRLLKKVEEGLEAEGIEVTLERLGPVNPYPFPFRTNLRLIGAMAGTFFRRRMTIQPIRDICYGQWDCIILAGPTWSYQPSGPMLDFLDRYGRRVCEGNLVIPFISCRSYWRVHYWSLKHRLQRAGALPTQPIVFVHPIKEPWRLIGLLLQLRGKMVRRRDSWFRKHYPAYGHSTIQDEEAKAVGHRIALQLQSSVGGLNREIE